MKRDYEYRYFMDDNKLMRFHLEQEEYWENPRNDFGGEGYFTKMYMRNREYDCTDDKIDVESNADALRMMISDADIDIVEAVDSGKIPRMEIKYDDEYEGYELWVDGYCEVDEDYCDKSWLADDIAEYLTIDDLEKASDDLYVIALDFTYYDGGIRKTDSDNPDGYIWTCKNDMIKAGFKDMSSEDLRKRAYEVLEADIDTENCWATGNVFWYEIEECTNVADYENEANWIENDSCGGFIVDGWKAYDEIYDDVIGGTPYHDDLDDLYEWPEFRISFDDYFKVLSEADTDVDLDDLREVLVDKIDWSVKSLKDCITEVSESIASLKSCMDTIISSINHALATWDSDGSIYPVVDGASTNYHKTYEDYTDKSYRLRELKSIEESQVVYESEVA